jgi:hypothetical protein
MLVSKPVMLVSMLDLSVSMPVMLVSKRVMSVSMLDL